MFDIETNGLLKDVNVLHCMCIYDTETEKMYRYDPTNVLEGVKKLQREIDNGGLICGHNIIEYDIPALAKLYPNDFKMSFSQQGLIIDTLVMSRLIYSNIETIDLGLMKSGKLPS